MFPDVTARFACGISSEPAQSGAVANDIAMPNRSGSALLTSPLSTTVTTTYLPMKYPGEGLMLAVISPVKTASFPDCE
jgi:hypothetical protein